MNFAQGNYSNITQRMVMFIVKVILVSKSSMAYLLEKPWVRYSKLSYCIFYHIHP